MAEKVADLISIPKFRQSSEAILTLHEKIPLLNRSTLWDESSFGISPDDPSFILKLASNRREFSGKPKEDEKVDLFVPKGLLCFDKDHQLKPYIRYGKALKNYYVPETKSEVKIHKSLRKSSVVLSVEFFEPNTVNKKKLSEFLVLGQQKFSDLRDALFCLSDLFVGRESKAFKSSFFFVEGVFYCDERSIDSEDLSLQIREWFEEGKSDYNNSEFEKKSMSDTEFHDLEIRLDHPYLFTHNGICTHVFKFSDLRILNSDDEHDISRYPLMIFKDKVLLLKCTVCGTRRSECVSMHDNDIQDHYVFWCKECYEDFYEMEHRKEDHLCFHIPKEEDL
ncbi:small nuclear RNA activating complex, polypeptide 3 [Nowakowskiella sp. JEL0078]|nr:small nuclear RNA activating complex, polypeptide 3 [Nowakowskiella sp. JEL0078]